MAQALPLLLGAGSSTALSVGAAALTAISGFSQGQFNAQVAENNAAIALQNAEMSVFESQQTAQDQDLAASQELGALIAQAGASGLSLTSGSISGRRAGLETLAARDRERIRQGGEVQARASRQQSADFSNQATQSRAAGRNALIGGAFDIGTSLVSGASLVNRLKARGIRSGVIK